MCDAVTEGTRDGGHADITYTYISLVPMWSFRNTHRGDALIRADVPHRRAGERRSLRKVCLVNNIVIRRRPSQCTWQQGYPSRRFNKVILSRQGLYRCSAYALVLQLKVLSGIHCLSKSATAKICRSESFRVCSYRNHSIRYVLCVIQVGDP